MLQVPKEEYLCEICDKQFKSQNQYQNHIVSNAHKKMVKQIMNQVGTPHEIEEFEKQQ